LETGVNLLTGPLGIGKSALAAKMVYKSDGAFYIRLGDLLMDIRDTWRGDRREKQVVEWYRNVPLLALDEVGIQAGSDNERNILYSIVVDRYENDKPTIMTTNLDPAIKSQKEELIKCIGARIADRIVGGVIRCTDWPRLRGK